MKDLEGRLRDALRAAADTVDETRPRPLPARRPRTRPGRAGVPHRLLMPVFAAGAIVLLLAGFVGVKGLRDEQVRRSAQQAEERMPRFFVASVPSADGRRSRLEIRDSGSGRVLDAEPAEAGADFREVAAAADNRTFFAISERLSARCQIAISRLSVSDSGTITSSDPVPGPGVDGTARGSGTLAVSPDGKMVSYGIRGCPESSERSVGGVFGVLDTGTGTRTEWLGPGTLEYAGMSWSGDGRYLFFVRTVLGDRDSAERQELRRIDLSGDAGDRAGYQVERGSTLIRGVDASRTIAGTAAGKDGREVVTVEAATAVSPSPSLSVRGSADAWAAAADTGDLLRISAADGRVLRSRDQQGMVSFDHPLLKGDASGRYLLTNTGALDTSGDEPARPISGLADVFDADW